MFGVNEWIKKMSGLDNMKKRMLFEGGGLSTSDGRNVNGKLLSFNSALWNSYQAEWITFDNDETKQRHRCLINPDKLKEDYDQKEISIKFEDGLKEGQTFCWTRTNTHWIVYLQRYEEEAYFRAQIRRCDYQLFDKYWIYLRGPVETALIWRQKHQIEMNELNYSIMFYIEKNEETLEKLSRLNIIKFDGHNWRVAATDKYSQPGLIEVYLEEYFDNEMEDNMVVPEIIEPDTTKPYIDGPQFVKPYDENVSFSIVGKSGGVFVVNSSKVKIIDSNETSCVVNIMTGKSGTFTITYFKDGEDDVTMDVTIKSL